MTRVSPILILALLMGCSGRSTLPDKLPPAPALPALTQSLAAPCPPLNLLVDRAIGTLVQEDSNAAFEYARCQSKQAEVVSLYEKLRQSMLDFVSKLK